VVETANALPVGQVRFQKKGDSWELHYSLDAGARGRGLAKPLLETAMAAFRAGARQTTVFGRVKASNTVSSHVFERLGFTSGQEGEVLVYRHPI
jgi:RimJ/RimL family protein N-acetyltransferase